MLKMNKIEWKMNRKCEIAGTWLLSQLQPEGWQLAGRRYPSGDARQNKVECGGADNGLREVKGRSSELIIELFREHHD